MREVNPLLAKVFGLKVSIEQKQGSNCLEAWLELEVAVNKATIGSALVAALVSRN